MATGKNPTGRGPGDAKRQKIIDLEAKEVSRETASDSSGAESEAKAGEKETTTSPASTRPSSTGASSSDPTATSAESGEKAEAAADKGKDTTKTKDRKQADADAARNEDIPAGEPAAARESAATADGGDEGGIGVTDQSPGSISRPVSFAAAALLGGIVAVIGNTLVERYFQNEPASIPTGADAATVAQVEDKIQLVRSEFVDEVTKLRDDIEPRFGSIESRVGELAGSVESTQKELADLQSVAPGGGGGGASMEAISGLTARLDAVEERISSQSQAAAADQPTQDQLAALSGEINRISGELAQFKTEAGDVSSKIDAFANTASEIEAAAARVREIRDAMAESQDLQTRQALAAALASAQANDAAIAALIGPVEAITGKSADLTQLGELAKAGIASDEELINGLRAATPAILMASGPEPDGVVGKLMSNAMSLVTVKPAGPTEGNDPAAILTRVEAALDKGRPADALDEWQNLPESARAAAQQWQDRLTARVRADALVALVISRLTPDGGGPTNTGGG